MEISFEDTSDYRRLELSGEMVVRNLSRALPRLRESLEGATSILVDLSGVSELDSAGVQVLISLKKQSLASGQKLRLTGHSPAVLAVFDLYGLVAFFGDRITLKKGERARYDFSYGVRRRG